MFVTWFRVVIPSKLRKQDLSLLHIGHFGINRTKQFARSSVYWPNINKDIEELCRQCSVCQEFQNNPSKAQNHPWITPDKPWSRVHIDHAINFMGSNWLIMVDAYSKYPCIYPTSSITAQSTMELLEQDFTHFGYPHELVSDNDPTFMSDDFQRFLNVKGIKHVIGAPNHPATNGQAERLVQTFKKSLNKSVLPPKEALNEFLMQYRRTPLTTGLAPCELLLGRDRY